MKKRILIVDDEKEDLQSMKDILETVGYDVTTANSGEEALKGLRVKGFDLILLDIRMPTLSGYDILRILRERANHKLKIVYVSIVPKQDVDMTGIDGFVQKPFSPETLLAEVKGALER